MPWFQQLFGVAPRHIWSTFLILISSGLFLWIVFTNGGEENCVVTDSLRCEHLEALRNEQQPNESMTSETQPMEGSTTDPVIPPKNASELHFMARGPRGTVHGGYIPVLEGDLEEEEEEEEENEQGYLTTIAVVFVVASLAVCLVFMEFFDRQDRLHRLRLGMM